MNTISHVYFKKLTPNCTLPKRGSSEAAGLDLCADFTNFGEFGLAGTYVLKPGERMLIKCGFAMALTKGYEAQVRPRSGLALKHGITVLNSPGTIDSDYRGEVGVILINTNSGGKDDTKNWFAINHGDRIAQMVIARVEYPEVYIMGGDSELPNSIRGAAGYGSTGVK